MLNKFEFVQEVNSNASESQVDNYSIILNSLQFPLRFQLKKIRRIPGIASHGANPY